MGGKLQERNCKPRKDKPRHKHRRKGEASEASRTSLDSQAMMLEEDISRMKQR